MADLTVLLENVEKPHNLSAILRTCDAVGVLEANAISKEERTCTFNSTAQGSQKWVHINEYSTIENAVEALKEKGFTLYGTNLDKSATDYRECNFTKATAFVLGAEKWGISDQGKQLIDQSIYIPMKGMVQSLNVSVAGAVLLFEALRQREVKGITPQLGEGLGKEKYKNTLFEWSYPDVAKWCKTNEKSYPEINSIGEIIEDLPRDIKMRY
tara:strand:- start:10993 stop:11628 length:636 start_codon:yes stop_codon:yes gene_type:complete